MPVIMKVEGEIAVDKLSTTAAGVCTALVSVVIGVPALSGEVIVVGGWGVDKTSPVEKSSDCLRTFLRTYLSNNSTETSAKLSELDLGPRSGSGTRLIEYRMSR